MEAKKDLIQKKYAMDKSAIRIQSVMLDKNIFTTPEEATSYVSDRLSMDIDRFDQNGDFFTFGQLSKSRFEEPLQEFTLGKGVTALIGRLTETEKDETDLDKIQDIERLDENAPSDQHLRKIERISERHQSVMQAIDDQNQKLVDYLKELDGLVDEVQKMRSQRKLSYEYLSSVLEKAKEHLPPDLFNEIHRFSRAYAGGKLKRKEDLEKSETVSNDVALALAALGQITVVEDEPAPKEEKVIEPPGGEISKSAPESNTKDEPENIWRWGSGKIPLFIEPRLKGTRLTITKAHSEFSELFTDGKDSPHTEGFREVLKTIDQDFTIDAIITMQDEKPKMILLDVSNLGKDLSKEPLAKRKAILKNFFSAYLLGKEAFGLVDTKEVSNANEVDAAKDWAAAVPGSQGLMAKSSLGAYEDKSDWLQLLCEASEPTIEVPIQKIDEDKRYVFGVVLEPDTVDAQGDIISADQIQKSAYEFMRDSQTVGLNHEKKIDSVVIHNEIVQDENAKRFGSPVKKGSWFMGVFVGDEKVWQEVKDGGLNSFSIGGVGIRSPLKLQTPA